MVCSILMHLMHLNQYNYQIIHSLSVQLRYNCKDSGKSQHVILQTECDYMWKYRNAMVMPLSSASWMTAWLCKCTCELRNQRAGVLCCSNRQACMDNTRVACCRTLRHNSCIGATMQRTHLHFSARYSLARPSWFHFWNFFDSAGSGELLAVRWSFGTMEIRQHFLNFFSLPHGHGWFGLGLCNLFTVVALWFTSLEMQS